MAPYIWPDDITKWPICRRKTDIDKYLHKTSSGKITPGNKLGGKDGNHQISGPYHGHGHNRQHGGGDGAARRLPLPAAAVSGVTAWRPGACEATASAQCSQGTGWPYAEHVRRACLRAVSRVPGRLPAFAGRPRAQPAAIPRLRLRADVCWPGWPYAVHAQDACLHPVSRVSWPPLARTAPLGPGHPLWALCGA